MHSSSPSIHVMSNAALKVGKSLVRDFKEIENLRVSSRSIQNFSKIACTRAEKTIIRELTRSFPDYNILTETQNITGSEQNYTWIINPLDGIDNFMRGLPFFAITIGLLKKKDIISGIIYDPIQNHMYWAEKGKGAFLNNTRIRINHNKLLKTCILCTETSMEFFSQITQQCAQLRILKTISLSLALLASGRIDVCAFAKSYVGSIAAGVLLVKEAGGIADDLYKKENVLDSCCILAANPSLFQNFRSIVSQNG